MCKFVRQCVSVCVCVSVFVCMCVILWFCVLVYLRMNYCVCFIVCVIVSMIVLFIVYVLFFHVKITLMNIYENKSCKLLLLKTVWRVILIKPLTRRFRLKFPVG